MKTVFVRPERCIGCKHCEIACAVEHSQTKNLFTAIFEEPLPKPRIHVTPTLGVLTFPVRCRHCNPAPCMQVCPSGAITRDDETDTVLIDEKKCIGCGMCGIVCPYDVITYYRSWKVKINREVATKCDNCIDRVKNGMLPACVEACKTGALVYGDVNEIIKEERKKSAKKIATALTVAEGEVEAEVPDNIKIWRDLGLKIYERGEENGE